MKSEIVNGKTPEPKRTYPYLGLLHGNVVLFTKARTGMVVAASDTANYTIGYESAGWSEENFAYFTGELILSNVETK